MPLAGARAHTGGVISSSDLIPGGLTGRAAETAAVRRSLTRSKLVTVTGLPGVGKTATAITAAAGVSGDFPDGVALIRLDALQDEGLLPHTIAAAMLLPDTFVASPLSALTEQLKDKRTLLVLDTCEHLLGACATISSALGEQCPDVRVLATSREPLRVPGEDTMAIAPLPMRDAVELLGSLTEMARSSEVNHAIDPADRKAGAVCDRLDRLPLALGMAARQLATGSLDALLTALDGGYEFLTDPDATIPRHRTLHAAIGWSHQLCTPAERLLWARLSVFDGPFSVKDCLEVCVTTHLSDEIITVGVAMLAERSLLLREAGEPPRYTMPHVIRAYGLGMLRRLAEDEEMRRRYRRWRSGPRRDEVWN
jgi:predicted ATPase